MKMRKILKPILTLSILLLLSAIGFGIYSQYSYRTPHSSDEKPMVIFIPSYNNKEWYKQNLDSIFSQNYQNYRVIYIDDASPDGTGELVRQYIREKRQEKRVNLIVNKERLTGLENIYRAVWLCDKNEIAIEVDGDDWFPHPHVLSYLNKIYQDPNVWLTYGQYITYPSSEVGMAGQVPQEVIDQNSIRTVGGYVTHLRTFYAGLFQKIKKEDMFYEGKFLTSASDSAFMIPMTEMAGNHARFIPEILYVYNRSNPINDDKVDRALQHRLDLYMRSKERYSPLASL